MGMHFGKALRELLVEPYTVEYLYRALDRDRSTFHRLMTGVRDPSPDLLIEIARALTACPHRLQAEPDRTFLKVWLKLAIADRKDRDIKAGRALEREFGLIERRLSDF